jgi:MFS family permease
VNTGECNEFNPLLIWRHIQAVTAYSPVLLKQAGYSDIKQNGLAGGINTIGIIGTIISAQIIDRFGRRVCLMGGAGVLSAVNLIVRLSSFGNRMSV